MMRALRSATGCSHVSTAAGAAGPHRRSAPAMRCGGARGFVLPAVLMTMLVVALIATALETAVWHAARTARLGFAGERALHAADAAVAETVARWDAGAFASLLVGQRTTTAVALGNGLSAVVTVVRSAIDAAVIEAAATAAQNGAPLTAHRRVTRLLVVRTPPLPLQGVVTTLGTATFAAGASTSASDATPPGWSTECAGVPPIDAVTPVAVVTGTALAAAQASFDAHWSEWRNSAHREEHASSVTPLAPVVMGSTCAPGAGDPLRSAGSIAPCTNEWGARLLADAHPARLTGINRHQGALLVDGDLVVEGSLELRGLLVVRGALDASAGRLVVHGAVLVRDDSARGTRFGNGTDVRYSQCALRRALAAMARPAPIANGSWLERP